MRSCLELSPSKSSRGDPASAANLPISSSRACGEEHATTDLGKTTGRRSQIISRVEKTVPNSVMYGVDGICPTLARECLQLHQQRVPFFWRKVVLNPLEIPPKFACCDSRINSGFRGHSLNSEHRLLDERYPNPDDIRSCDTHKNYWADHGP